MWINTKKEQNDKKQHDVDTWCGFNGWEASEGWGIIGQKILDFTEMGKSSSVRIILRIICEISGDRRLVTYWRLMEQADELLWLADYVSMLASHKTATSQASWLFKLTQFIQGT